ncbi:MAG: hypothetical protein P8Y30_08830, partial [candidate division WOR-3 bacterium]
MIDERISSLERKAEEESNYVKVLRGKFGKQRYYSLLKDALLKLFTPAELDSLGGCGSKNYIVFSGNLQTELKKGLKSMRDLLSEGEKKYLTTQLDDFTRTLNMIFDEGVKTGISPILIEFALKRWLKVQMPLKSAIPIHKKIGVSLRFFSKRELHKVTSKRKLISLTEKALIVPSLLPEVKIEDFSGFIEAGDQIDSNDIKEKITSTRDLIKENASKKIRDIFGAVDELSVNEILQQISEIVKYINSGEAKVRALNSQLLRVKELSMTQEQINVPGIFRFFDPDFGKKIKENINRSKVALNEGLGAAPERFLSRSLLGRKTDFESVIDWFIRTYNEIFLPCQE